MDASERPWVLDTGSPYGNDEHFIIDSEELETCVATVPFHGPDERDSAEANAKHIVLAVNMHDKLVAFLKGHEQFETDVAAANDFNCEPASLPPPLYDDLLGMRCMRDELLKEAQGDK